MELLICAVITIALWWGTGWPLVWCVAAVVLGWVALRGGGIGNLFTGISNAVGGTFAFIRRLVVFITVFAAIMVVASRFISVTPAAATGEIAPHGWLIWRWGFVGIPAIAMVLCALIAAYVAAQAAQGNATPAARIVVGSLVIILVMRWIPQTVAGVMPTENVGGTPTPTWNATDAAIAKAYKEGGAAKVLGATVTTVAIGNSPDVKKRGAIGSSVCRVAHWGFGERLWFGVCGDKKKSPKPKTTATRTATTSDSTVEVVAEAEPAIQPAVYHPPVPAVTVIRIGREKKLYRFSPDNGCTEPIRLEGNWADEPQGGGEIIFFSVDTGREVLRDWPGKRGVAQIYPGYYTVCAAEDSVAWGVEITYPN